jgi:integrase
MRTVTSPVQEASTEVLSGVLAGNSELIDEHRRLGQLLLSPQTLFSFRGERDRAGGRVPISEHEHRARFDRGEQLVSRVRTAPLVQPDRVFAMRAAMVERFRTMVDMGAGCGLRQGEILGLSVDELDFDSGTLHVVQQLKLSLSKAVFAPPKGGKLRDVPLPDPVAEALKEHIKRFPPVEITLPWMRANGQPVTKRLIFTGPNGGHVWRTSLNEDHWKPALASVGVIPKAKSREHTAAREHGMHALRHFYASVLLDAGESIKAVSEYLGHSDPGLTLKVYAHLMPSSRDRARKALGQALRPPQDPPR